MTHDRPVKPTRLEPTSPRWALLGVLALAACGVTEAPAAPDAHEARVALRDVDGDGIADIDDVDDDNDGILDVYEGFGDIDQDGVPNSYDLDSDNDGMPDTFEAFALSDWSHPIGDQDGDGLDDAFTGMAPVDTDGDGRADFVDLDSDGDAIFDFEEFGTARGTNDFDLDGIPDEYDPSPDFGPIDAGIGDVSNIAPSWRTAKDSDRDGVPDGVDVDADNDGIIDTVEMRGRSLTSDLDNDQIPDWRDIDTGLCSIDANGDGICDVAPTAFDPDGDGLVNAIDLDSDGDAIPDLIESQPSPWVSPLGIDSDGDGLDDLYAPNIQLVDTDSDGIADMFDDDSDDDGVLDVDEHGWRLSGFDADRDGLDDAVDAAAGSPGPADANLGTADFGDADNDLTYGGDFDFRDAVVDPDTDLDGVIDAADIDRDGDGILDRFETEADPDGDGLPAFMDVDSDSDGLPDNLEAQPVWSR
jgi:hypothetical protein